MKKSDLKNGMVVEARNGKRYLYMKTLNCSAYDELFCGQGGGWYQAFKINEDLTFPGQDELTVDKVFTGPTSYDLYSKETGKLIWERPKEKTHEIDGKEFSESTIKAALKAYVN